MPMSILSDATLVQVELLVNVHGFSSIYDMDIRSERMGEKVEL